MVEHSLLWSRNLARRSAKKEPVSGSASDNMVGQVQAGENKEKRQYKLVLPLVCKSV